MSSKPKSTKTVKPFQPVTIREHFDYAKKLEDFLERIAGKDSVQALRDIQALYIFADLEPTLEGQKGVTKLRNRLNRFFKDVDKHFPPKKAGTKWTAGNLDT